MGSAPDRRRCSLRWRIGNTGLARSHRQTASPGRAGDAIRGRRRGPLRDRRGIQGPIDRRGPGSSEILPPVTGEDPGIDPGPRPSSLLPLGRRHTAGHEIPLRGPVEDRLEAAGPPGSDRRDTAPGPLGEALEEMAHTPRSSR